MSSARTSCEAGFTLVEVMAALAVFSLAALALLHLSGENLRAAGMAREHALATLLAENLMAETMVLPAPPLTVSGEEAMGGVDWAWRRTVNPSGEPGMARIDVEVRRADDERLAASLTGFRSDPE